MYLNELNDQSDESDGSAIKSSEACFRFVDSSLYASDGGRTNTESVSSNCTIRSLRGVLRNQPSFLVICICGTLGGFFLVFGVSNFSDGIGFVLGGKEELLVPSDGDLSIGELAPGQTKSGIVRCRNNSNQVIVVRSVSTSCTCTVVDKPNSIAPGGAGEFQYNVSMPRHLPKDKMQVQLLVEIANAPSVTWVLEGVVGKSKMRLIQTEISFGEIEQGRGEAKTIVGFGEAGEALGTSVLRFSYTIIQDVYFAASIAELGVLDTKVDGRCSMTLQSRTGRPSKVTRIEAPT